MTSMITGFLVTALCAVAILLIGLFGVHQIENASRQILADQTRDLIAAEHLEALDDDHDGSTRAYLLTRREEFLRARETARQKLDTYLPVLEQHATSPEGRMLLGRIVRALDDLDAAYRQSITANLHEPEVLAALWERAILPRRQVLDAAIDALLAHKVQRFEQAVARMQTQSQRVTFLVLASALGALATAGLLAFVFVRSARKRLLERERMFDQTDSERRLLSAVLEQMPAGVALIRGPGGQAMLHNKEAEALLGQQVRLTDMSSHEQSFEAYHLDGRPYTRREQVAARALRGEVIVREELLYRRPDGELRTLLLSGAPLRSDDSEAAGAVVTFTDISALRQAEQRLHESEERFRLAARAVAGVVYDWDLSTDRVWHSEGLLRIVGMEPEAARMDRAWWVSLMHPDDVARVRDLFELHMASPDAAGYEIEYRLHHQLGHWVDVWDQGLFVRDAHGEVTRIIGSTVDISLRKRAERELRYSRKRLELILASVAEGIYGLDTQGTCTFANAAAARLLGYPGPDALVGTPIHELIHHTRADGSPYPREACPVHRTVSHGTACHLEGELLFRADGSAFPVEYWSHPLRTGHEGHDEQDHQVLGAVVTFVDITERQRVQAEHEALIASLRETVKFAELFLGILGHDLRNPLNAIITTAQTLGPRRNSEDPVPRAAVRILLAGQRMARMISQLLDFTRIRIGGGFALECRSVELVAICQRIIEELEAAHPQAALALEQAGNVMGSWDEDRIAQALSNLIANAIQHSPDKRVLARIDGTDPEALTIEFQNQGAIPPELLPVIFDPFRGARQSSGLGLGLYITQQIIAAHGGTIEVQSSEADGTSFLIVLPRIPPPMVRRQQLAGTVEISALRL